ncbi:MAG: glycosyltransferase [Candidatus Eisenbacteria bacterium]|nr:glycosyltransferase [Candidatus Latescibacterota bacterium]MBD3303074.1 glycosyltransferase [Candidatus Eisenbacteria bacterium]
MKRLVTVAYFFPPTGGAGVQRTVKFVRYLPEHGWSPAVVTVASSHYWMRDESLAAEIPPSVPVVRTAAVTGPAVLGKLGRGGGGGQTNARRSGRLQGLLRRIASWGTVPDPYVGWVPFAARAARRLLGPGDVLLTTSSPDSAHLVGLRLAGRGIPWVADFRDPWTRRMSFAPATGWHRRLHERLEGAVVRNADRIVVTAEATGRDFLARYPFLDPGRVVWIPNGFDASDFPREAPPVSDRFTLLHLGQLNPERPVGPLLDVLEAFLRRRPEARENLAVELIGPRYREDEREVERRGLGGTVRFLDSLPHREATARLLRARVLVLMEQESDRGGLILPGKVFEYLHADRPILGLVPRGAAWDLIASLGAGACALPSDPEAGSVALARFYDRYRAGESPRSGADRSAVARFERRRLAGRLAALLDEVSLRPASASPPPSR